MPPICKFCMTLEPPKKLGKRDATLARIAHRSIQAACDRASAWAALGVLLAFRAARLAAVPSSVGPRPTRGTDRGGARQVRRRPHRPAQGNRQPGVALYRPCESVAVDGVRGANRTAHHFCRL